MLLRVVRGFLVGEGFFGVCYVDLGLLFKVFFVMLVCVEIVKLGFGFVLRVLEFITIFRVKR